MNSTTKSFGFTSKSPFCFVIVSHKTELDGVTYFKKKLVYPFGNNYSHFIFVPSKFVDKILKKMRLYYLETKQYKNDWKIGPQWTFPSTQMISWDESFANLQGLTTQIETRR